MTQWDPFDADCPTRRLLSRIGDKWTVLVVVALRDGPLRYSELRRRIGGVSQRMLTLTLKALVADGLIKRDVESAGQVQVFYELTELGWTLQEPLDALVTWSTQNMAAVQRARTAASAE